MSDISNFPYFEVQFNQQGRVVNQTEVDAVLNAINAQSITDLVVISHGWNNDMDDARNLYRRFLATLRAVLNAGQVAGVNTRSYAVLAVLWPSKKFADADLIAGGAASLGSPIANDDIKKQLDTVKELINTPQATTVLDQAKRLVAELEDSPPARQQFADLVRSVLPQDAANEEDASTTFFAMDGEDVMNRLSKPVILIERSAGRDEGGASAISDFATSSDVGGAAGFSDLLTGPKAAAQNLLNFTTYYQMKQRSEVVGREGVSPLLRTIRTQHPALKLHLIGHSFGGRLVTAAAMGPNDQPLVPINSIALLQAAFSHYGFAENFEGTKDGFFRRLVQERGVLGPILITCSKNDTAVGIAYPLASMLSQDDATGLGDENDRFGGLGRNGAQKTVEVVKGLSLLPVGGAYSFQAGKLHNLKADAFIKDHGDICGQEVAYAVLTGIAMT